MADVTIDWDALAKTAGEEFKETLKGVVGGAEEDLREYGRAIMADTIRLLRSGGDGLRDELRAQAKLLAEINRIRINDGALEFVERLAVILGRVALGAIGSMRAAA